MRINESRQYRFVVILVLLGLIAACKPKQLEESATATASAAVATQVPVQAPSSAVNANNDGQTGASAVSEPTESGAAAQHSDHHQAHHEHQDINAVADKLDPAVKENLEQLIEQREQAIPTAQPLAGGGQAVQLNGSRDSIAVAVVNEEGEVQIYHHGEALKPVNTEAHANSSTGEAPAQIPEKVKPYPSVKQVHAPTARD